MVVILVCFFFIPLIVNDASAPTEQIVNGGFETGDFSGWSTSTELGRPASTILSNGMAHSGLHCAYVWFPAVIEQTFSPAFTPTSDLTYWSAFVADSGQFVVTVTYSDSTEDRGFPTWTDKVGSWCFYTFAVKHENQISKVRIEYGTESLLPRWLDDVSLSGVKTLRADLNQDGKVNILDLTIVAMAYGSRPGDAKWNPIADLDNNGVVNILDIAIVAADFGAAPDP